MRKFAAAVLPASALAASALGYDWNRRAQLETTSNPTHHKIVIVGGGSGGVTVASQLQNKLKAEDNDVCIVEPSTTHYYQPLWTLVGGGQFGVADPCKPMSSVIPKNTRWIQDHVAKFKPDDNQLELASGKKLSYDFLVVATGIQSHFDYIPGLKDTIGENGVCSIYDSNQCERVFDSISKTSEGTAIFTVPSTPIKCGGAPQKIMYLAEDYWREKGLRSLDQVHVTFAPAGPSMFPVKHYGDALNDLRKKKGIEALFSHELVEVDGPNHVATFKTPTGNVQHKFSMLHVVPLMKTPLPLRESPLVNAGGFVEVDKHTTQSTKYPNVFSLGDCSSLPTSKTAAAITSEAPVLVENLVSTIQNRPLTAKYDGYTSCPIIVGTNKLMLAEFYGPGYGGAISETFPWDQRNPTSILFYLKKYFFPWAYWNHMLAGRWYGRNHFFPPEF